MCCACYLSEWFKLSQRYRLGYFGFLFNVIRWNKGIHLLKPQQMHALLAGIICAVINREFCHQIAFVSAVWQTVLVLLHCPWARNWILDESLQKCWSEPAFGLASKKMHFFYEGSAMSPPFWKLPIDDVDEYEFDLFSPLYYPYFLRYKECQTTPHLCFCSTADMDEQWTMGSQLLFSPHASRKFTGRV